MSKWEGLFESFTSKRVLVVGDVMIDSYLFGKVDRISPEAPVPVVSVQSRDHRLGGAANVALNLKALGAQVSMVAVCGDDEHGSNLFELFAAEGIETRGILKSTERRTTVKHRIIGNNHQMLRVDDEDLGALNSTDTKRLLEHVGQVINQIDVVLFEDYNKGLLTRELIEGVTAIAKEQNIPTVVDPKKDHFLDYLGVTLFKPNLKEIQEGLGIKIDPRNKEDVKLAMQSLRAKLGCRDLLVTLSEFGVAYLQNEDFYHIPAHKRDIADVSGAGDTVVSVAALALAAEAHAKDIAAISNLAGGLVCEELGVVPIDKNALLQEAIRLYS